MQQVQQPPQPPQPAPPQPPQPAGLDPVRVQAIINALANQRNAAQDAFVNAQAELAILQARIQMLEAVNKQLMEATLPPVPPPMPEPVNIGTGVGSGPLSPEEELS